MIHARWPASVGAAVSAADASANPQASVSAAADDRFAAPDALELTTSRVATHLPFASAGLDAGFCCLPRGAAPEASLGASAIAWLR